MMWDSVLSQMYLASRLWNWVVQKYIQIHSVLSSTVSEINNDWRLCLTHNYLAFSLFQLLEVRPSCKHNFDGWTELVSQTSVPLTSWGFYRLSDHLFSSCISLSSLQDSAEVRHHFLWTLPDPMMNQLLLLCAPPKSIYSHPFTAICALFCNFLLTCLNTLLTRILDWLL